MVLNYYIFINSDQIHRVLVKEVGANSIQVRWPSICSGCGQQDVDLGEPFKHTFEHVKSVGSKYAGGKTTTTTTLGSDLYVCTECKRESEEYAKLLENAANNYLPGFGYLGLAFSFLFLWLSLEVERMFPAERLIVFFPLNSGLYVLALGSLVGSYLFMRTSMIGGANSLASETREKPFLHYVSFSDSFPEFRSKRFQTVFTSINPSMPARHRAPRTPLKEPGKLKLSMDDIIIGLVFGYGIPFGVVYLIGYLTSIGILA